MDFFLEWEGSFLQWENVLSVCWHPSYCNMNASFMWADTSHVIKKSRQLYTHYNVVLHWQRSSSHSIGHKTTSPTANLVKSIPSISSPFLCYLLLLLWGDCFSINTYPSNSFKVIPIFFKVYQVPVEWPSKHDIQRVIMRYLTGQDNAFSNSDIHAERWHHNPGWIYKQQRKQSAENQH